MNPIVELCARKMCIYCAKGVHVDNGRHFVDDGLQPKGKIGRYVKCAAAAIRAITPAEIAAVAGEPLTAKEKYDKYMQDDKEPSAIERLRFFCSLAMNAPDWMDAAQFFDAIYAAPAAPEGMKLVPLEPTEEMLHAGVRAFQHTYDWDAPLTDWRHCYKAMLAACGEEK